jgi:membrane protease YdiL (CAAX protease family)
VYGANSCCWRSDAFSLTDQQLSNEKITSPGRTVTQHNLPLPFPAEALSSADSSACGYCYSLARPGLTDGEMCMRKVQAGIKVSVPALVLFILAAHLVRALLESWLRDNGLDTTLSKDLSYLVVPPILLLLTLPYLRLCKKHLVALLRPSACTRGLVIASICVGAAMRAAYWAAITACAALGVIQGDDASAISAPFIEFLNPATSLVILSFFVMAILIPVTEELVNRGLVLHALLNRGALVAVTLSAAIFAVMHSPQTYIMSFMGGIVLGVQTLKFRTLWAALVTHATFNTIVIIEQKFVHFVWSPAYPDLRLALFSLVIAVIAITAILALLLPLHKNAAGTLD